MIISTISDGHGSGNKIKINGEGELSVVVHPHPPKDEIVTVLPFRQYFTTNGATGGTSAMNVNGATNNVEYYVKASYLYDIYINSISIEIGDTGTLTLNNFGALSSLTNGVEWIYFTQEAGEYQLHEGIKTNKEFIKIGQKTGAIGDGTTAYLADVSGGASEKSYLPTIDISETFGMPWGLRLRKKTNDRLVFKIKDNLTGLTTFEAIAYGIRQD